MSQLLLLYVDCDEALGDMDQKQFVKYEALLKVTKIVPVSFGGGRS